MEKMKKLGLAGGMLAVALLLGGCGAHAGFRIGKASTPTQAYASNATVSQAEVNDVPE